MAAANIFLNPIRPHKEPADQETVLLKQTFEDSTQEVSVVQTVQCDLICQVFDTATQSGSRRYIGERGEYPRDAAAEFIRKKAFLLLGARPGICDFPVVLSVDEVSLHTWHTAAYDVRLVHNKTDDKLDWIVFFSGERRVERVPAGNMTEVRHLLPFWRAGVPNVVDAGGIVSVSFPGNPPNPEAVAAPPPALRPAQIAYAPGGNAFVRYYDNIPALANEVTIFGYVWDLGFFQSSWSYAPWQDGNRPYDLSNLSVPISWWGGGPKASVWEENVGWGTPRTLQGSLVNGIRRYHEEKDLVDRGYFMVPANGGWVPVRHPTDPMIGNWLSKDNLTKIVYDTHRTRWPACEGIDYHKHGFVPYGENNKIWWPIKNGQFQPSFVRVKDPYFSDYRELDRKTTQTWRTAQKVLAAATMVLQYNITNKAAVAYEQVSGVINAGYAPVQALDPLVAQERRDNEQRQLAAEKEYFSQRDVLNILEMQDIYDRGEGVIKATAKGALSSVQELIQNGPIPMELRSQAVILSATHGYRPILNTLLKETDMDARIIKAARIAAMEKDRGAIVIALREYENRARPIPR